MGASISALSGGSSFLSSIHHQAPFIPTSDDIKLAASYLSRPGLLPPELALLVLDYAEYWTVEVAESRKHQSISAAPSGNANFVKVLVTPQIIGSGSHGISKCVRRIRVTTESRDQGFSDFPQFHGTTKGSSSWFELALIRPVDPPPPDLLATLSTPTPPTSTGPTPPATSLPTATPSPMSTYTSNERLPSYFRTVHRVVLFHNLHAVSTFHSKTVTFTSFATPAPSTSSSSSSSSTSKRSGASEPHSRNYQDESDEEDEREGEVEREDEDEEEEEEEEDESEGGREIVRLAEKGDRFVVFACAKYPGWQNHVRGCKVEVFSTL